jgi:hypothetical protein
MVCQHNAVHTAHKRLMQNILVGDPAAVADTFGMGM